MKEPLDILTRQVWSKLRILDFTKPGPVVLRALLQIAFNASLKTEENQFVRGSLTYSDPNEPELVSPRRRRADFPSFTAFDHRTPLTASALVKFSRAVNIWSGSIAVYGTKTSNLFIWGVVDQLVQHNIRLNLESNDGFAAPGILTINIDGIGDLSVYHGDLFLGRVRHDRAIVKESDALRSVIVARRIYPILAPIAKSIALALRVPEGINRVANLLFDAWTDTIARICIGLRRVGTGGSLLITPKPIAGSLDVGHRFRYRRLSDSTILNVLDSEYLSRLEWQNRHEGGEGGRSCELSFAKADAEDRSTELTGAIKLVTSLAAADGLVLMDGALALIGFGVKIGAAGKVGAVYDGPDFSRKGTAAKKCDTAHFGTRHGSMLRYCQADRNAIGLVISQDGQVRLIASEGRSLTLWNDVKLLGHSHDVASYAREARRYRADRRKYNGPISLGFSLMPKTVKNLLKRVKE